MLYPGPLPVGIDLEEHVRPVGPAGEVDGAEVKVEAPAEREA